MPSMAKVNNRVINYRDFSSKESSFFPFPFAIISSTNISFYYFRFEEKFCHAITIPGREIEVWPELPFHKWGRRREIRTWIPPRDPIKWKRENNGGLTSDLYLQNNAVSFFFSFRCSFFPSTRGQRPRCSIFFLIPASWCLSFTRCPPRRASFDERSSFVPRGIIVKWVCKDFNHHVYTCLIAVFFFSCIRRILSSNFP